MNSSSCATSPSIRCANTTSCPSTGARTWVTSRAAASSPACRSSRARRGYARRPQVQERLTAQVADAIAEVLDPQGVIVVIEAEHMCMSTRGISKPGSSTVTSALRGIMSDGATRAEMMALVLSGSR